MSYEYSSSAQRLDFPNPFRVENVFRFIAAGILVASGVYAIFLGRGALGTHLDGWALAPIIAGVAMLAAGLFHAKVGLSRLRFFFGRGKPEGLADELADKAVGESKRAKGLKAVLRENVIPFEEPTGALNGLLYSLLRPLIWAPQPIQWLAQRQFQTGLTLLVVLAGLLISMGTTADHKDMVWLGLFFFAYTAVLLLKKLEQGANARTGMGSRGLIVLVLIAILAPVLIRYVSPFLPDLGWIDLSGQALILLVCALVAVLVFFIAVLRQMVEPPQTTMACELATVSMNAPPNQLLDELDREMQRSWIEQIPNRRYSRVLPQVEGAAGTFQGELLEETQPMPRDDMRTVNFSRAFSEPRFRWLTVLSALGVLYTAAGATALVLFTREVAAQNIDLSIWKYLCFAGGMFSLALFCLRAGHGLWERFDFVSQLTWVEINGNFQRSHTAVGAQFTDRVRTEKEIISINDMTLRVWIAEVDTVTFGNSQRRIVGLRGRPDLAASLRNHLEAFAAEQSSVDMPTSRRDIEKIAALGALNQIGGEPPSAAGLLDTLIPAAGATAVAAKPEPTHCPSCKTAIFSGAKFCGQCGQGLMATA